MTERRLDWTNTIFIISAHVLGVIAIVYVAVFHFSWWTIGLGVVWFALCGLSITGGYHRLFAHPTYKTNKLLRGFYLLFGAASIQNSALKWSADHRVHHARTDKDGDPYNIRRGFWWAHIGWVLFEDPEREVNLNCVPDLEADPMIVWQYRYYVWIAIAIGAVLPAAIALSWGDPIGAILVAGFLRTVVQWHATFSVNSVAHLIGSQPYSTANSGRDSFITALITLGEGYHNFHHRFGSDYRNGVRWFHFDPTKWFVWTMSLVGMTWDLKRTPPGAIRRARESVLAAKANA